MLIHVSHLWATRFPFEDQGAQPTQQPVCYPRFLAAAARLTVRLTLRAQLLRAGLLLLVRGNVGDAGVLLLLIFDEKMGGFKPQQIGISRNFLEFHGNRMLPNHQIASKKTDVPSDFPQPAKYQPITGAHGYPSMGAPPG